MSRCGRESGKPSVAKRCGDVERKSVKERDGHFTARGQRARYTVADCAPIAICGSRPAFVDPRDTLSGARARPRCFHAPRAGWGYCTES
uniref:SFRICE_008360 n=1 Tax=Spodoptera frugiperda TaxID=7108 RepID=A0A2H1W2K4_SPOFR